MSGLSRDILKWLQSLDLSYSVKNVKRDFSNGFLIAEIFSRYFPHDVQMHSFDNGIGLTKKLSNWQLLEKFFIKKRVPVSREMIDGVVHCKDGASIPLLETIYTCLTSKKVHNVQPQNDDELIPPFARNTASFAIKESIRDSELITTLADETEVKNKASSVLDAHQQTLRNERVLEPGRFTGPSPQRSNQRVAPRPMPLEAPSGQIEFKEVEVRTIDRNITQLRASRDQNASLPRSDSGEDQLDTEDSDGKVMLVKPITTVLNSIVAKSLDHREQRLLDPSKDAIVSLVDRLVASKIDIDYACQVLEQVLAQCEELVSSFLGSPKEFWRMLAIFTPVLNLPETSPCYSLVLRILCDIGAKMTEHDAFLACGLFGDYGLPKLVPLLKGKPAKRKGLLGMTYCFCEASMHLRVIKALQDQVDDMSCFLQCIVILMHLEAGFSEDLLDLYIYYAMTGLGQQSASLRASALSMLVLVAETSHLLVMPMLDKLEAMKDDGWWEVGAQLLRVCAALLRLLSPQDEQCNRVCSLVQDVIANTHSPLVHKIGVSCLAPVLQSHATIKDAYTEALKALSERDFSAVMASPKEQRYQALGTSLAHMPILSPLNSLPPILVAETLSQKISDSGLENLEPEHVFILDSILLDPFDATEETRWLDVLKHLELHVYVALADDEICGSIVPVLHRWITHLEERAFQTFPTLGKSIKLIFSAEAAQTTPLECQKAALELLTLLKNSGEKFEREVNQLLLPMRAELASTILAPILKDL
mmetsp:Transcript_63195/g.131448  ORF Transcript_63195/g.131448 Transcript_63195/m.131448 type:complete len:761 (-) Transcript_63195:203-2485(-)